MSVYRRIDVSKVGDVTIVKFHDKKILDEAGIQELGAELFAVVEQDNRRRIVLNFTNVDFLSSAALGKLITLDRKAKAHQGRLKLSNIRPEILEVFQITKLNKVFDIRGEEAEAVNARGLSSEKATRTAFARQFGHQLEKISGDLQTWLPKIKEAYALARIINHEAGFRLMKTVSDSKGWDLNFNEIARIWTNGCIIRSELMESIALGYSHQVSFLELPGIREKVKGNRKDLAEVVGIGLTHGFALPVLSAGANYLLARMTAESSASVIQAQRDYFGAHTYQRKDDPSGAYYHTHWTQS